MLLAWGRFPVSKAIIPDGQEHFLTPSAHRDTHLFGGLGVVAFSLLLYSLLLQGVVSLPQRFPADHGILPTHREFAVATVADENGLRLAADGFMAGASWAVPSPGGEVEWEFVDTGPWTLNGQRVGVYGDLETSVRLAHPVVFTVCGRPAVFGSDDRDEFRLTGLRVVVLDQDGELHHILPLGADGGLPHREWFHRKGNEVSKCGSSPTGVE